MPTHIPANLFVGEVKLHGGKLVRVSLHTDSIGTFHTTIDGDFFTTGDTQTAFTAATHILDEHITQLRADATADDLMHWYHDTTRALTPAIESVLIGANADSIALATLRALATVHPATADALPAISPTALAAFEHERTERINQQWQHAQTSSAPAELLLDSATIQQRWHDLHPEIIVDEPRLPEEQMHIEHQWAQEVAQGDRGPTLRFWDWGAPAVVCGKFQSIEDEVNLDVAHELGVHVVRRDSGGGAMYIEPEHTITYSLYAPLSFVDGLTVQQSFQLCDSWLIAALNDMGIEAHFAGLNDIAGPNGKIGGAAQQRVNAPTVANIDSQDGAAQTAHSSNQAQRKTQFDTSNTSRQQNSGCVLHHTTLAVDMNPEILGKILNVSAQKMSDKAIKSAAKRVEPLRVQTELTRAQIVSNLVQFVCAWGTV